LGSRSPATIARMDQLGKCPRADLLHGGGAMGLGGRSLSVLSRSSRSSPLMRGIRASTTPVGIVTECKRDIFYSVGFPAGLIFGPTNAIELQAVVVATLVGSRYPKLPRAPAIGATEEHPFVFEVSCDCGSSDVAPDD